MFRHPRPRVVPTQSLPLTLKQMMGKVDLRYVSRTLRMLAIIFIALDGVMVLMGTPWAVVSGDPYTRLHVAKEFRWLAGGLLMLVASRGISSGREWGRILAERVVLVSSLFGLTSIGGAFSGGLHILAAVSGALWFAFLAYAWHWLNRPDIKSKFALDDTSEPQGGIRRFAPVVLAFAAVVAVVTSDIELRSRTAHRVAPNAATPR